MSQASTSIKYETINYPHRCCEFSVSQDSCNIISVGRQLVKEVLCSAERYIAEDVAEFFYYKQPRYYRPSSVKHSGFDYQSTTSTKTTDATEMNNKQYFDYNEDLSYVTRSVMTILNREDARHPEDVEWSTIERFNIRDVGSQIRDYIELWQVMPGTKCALLPHDDFKMLRNKGRRYQIDALFSNPTPKCPNPLAVAKVHFFIHVPELMPKYYPVMVTYRFEGFQSMYYALGRKQIRSLDFQRFFIDTILHMKLNFYTELFECRFPQYKKPFETTTGDDDEDEVPYECEEQLTADEADESESVHEIV